MHAVALHREAHCSLETHQFIVNVQLFMNYYPPSVAVMRCRNSASRNRKYANIPLENNNTRAMSGGISIDFAHEIFPPRDRSVWQTALAGASRRKEM